MSHPPDLPPPERLSNPVQVDAYIWAASTDLLVPELWSYEEFFRDNIEKWVGPEARRNSYDDVDRRRGMNDVLVKADETT